MKLEVKHIDIKSAAKVSGAIGLLIGVILGLIYAIIFGIQYGFFAGIGLFIGVPLFYGFFLYLMGALYAWFYNKVVGRVGGIKVTFDKVKN